MHKMSETAATDTRSLVFRLLERYCAANGLSLTAADAHGHAGVVESPDGRRWPFKGTRFALNSQGAAEIAGDKAYTSVLLEREGLSVPRWQFLTAEEIGSGKHVPGTVLDLAQRAGFPLFVKPNDGREGNDVMRAGDHETLQDTLGFLARRHAQILAQEEVRGRELRVVLLDGEVLCAIERHPPKVTGDGRNSVCTLMNTQAAIDPADPRIAGELSRQGLTLESIPPEGQAVALLPVANLSAGGTAIVATDALSPDLAAIARRAARALALRYAAVDLIVPPDRPEAAAFVLEVNAAPGLANLARQGVQEAKLAEEISGKIFRAMFTA